jgi:hypothetical protein
MWASGGEEVPHVQPAGVGHYRRRVALAHIPAGDPAAYGANAHGGGALRIPGSMERLFWPLLLMSHMENYTLTVGLAFFKQEYYTQYTMLLAGSMINVAPLVVLFFFLQRYFIEGISLSGLGGR